MRRLDTSRRHRSPLPPMPKSYSRHKLLLDEQLYARESYPRLNEYFDLKHVRNDLHLGSATDPRVEDVAKAHGRIVVTQNGKHFRRLVKPDSPGVIDIPRRVVASPSRYETYCR